VGKTGPLLEDLDVLLCRPILSTVLRLHFREGHFDRRDWFQLSQMIESKGRRKTEEFLTQSAMSWKRLRRRELDLL